MQTDSAIYSEKILVSCVLASGCAERDFSRATAALVSLRQQSPRQYRTNRFIGAYSEVFEDA